MQMDIEAQVVYVEAKGEDLALVKARHGQHWRQHEGLEAGYTELHFTIPVAQACMFPVGFAVKIQITPMDLSKGYVWRDERDNNENS